MELAITPELLSSFVQVVLIDIALAGDNAVVIAMAAAGLPAGQRSRAIMFGIIAATVLRIAFASITVQLLQVVGLVLAGGILLLWVCWKMWRELHPEGFQWRRVLVSDQVAHDAIGTSDPEQGQSKSFRQAIFQIVLADVSMSLDNVLAVAGASREHPMVLVFGLALSVVLMGAAAVLISKILQRHRWIAYVGLAIIFYVALDMIFHGGQEVYPILASVM